MKTGIVEKWHWKPGPVTHGFDFATGPDETVITLHVGRGETSWRVEQAKKELQAKYPEARIVVMGGER